MKLGALRFDCSGLQIIAQPASHKSRVISVHRTAGLLRPGDICMYMHTYIHTYDLQYSGEAREAQTTMY